MAVGTMLHPMRSVPPPPRRPLSATCRGLGTAATGACRGNAPCKAKNTVRVAMGIALASELQGRRVKGKFKLSATWGSSGRSVGISHTSVGGLGLPLARSGCS